MEDRFKTKQGNTGWRRLLQGLTLGACGFALLGAAPEAEAADCRHKPAVCSHRAHKAAKRDTPAVKQVPDSSRASDSTCKLKPAVCHRLAVQKKRSEARAAAAHKGPQAEPAASRCRHKPAVCSRLKHQRD